MPNSFNAFGLSPEQLQVLGDLGYETPTPIQSASLPILMDGGDVIGQSRTGSGKTAAFALPLLHRLDSHRSAIQALVLCPTRELTAQVAREVRRLGRGLSGLRVLELVGGKPGKEQRESLERGAHIAIGTPGRVLDHLQRGSLDLRELQMMVLDEADRMLDMGFGRDVSSILQAAPGERQTALFSATFPEAIESMSAAFQQSPVRVEIEEREDGLRRIQQLQLQVPPDQKVHALCWLLDKFPHQSALVFCNFKASVALLMRELRAAGSSVDRLDGDLEQFHRDQVLARLRNGSVRVLLATDVAGRGIDVPELDLVINFEIPSQAELYVHRIGRTGRLDRNGVAVSITTHENDFHLEAASELTGIPIESLTWTVSEVPSKSELLDSLARATAMETILISGGRKDKVRPGDILGALTGEAGSLQGKDVGKIEIQDRLSYVAVSTSVVKRAVQQLNQGRIKGKKFRATHVGSLEGKSSAGGSPWS